MNTSEGAAASRGDSLNGFEGIGVV